jgi:hypothetical protein
VKFIHIEICETYHKRNPQNIPICPNTDWCASTRFCTSLFIFSNVYVSFQLFNFSTFQLFKCIRFFGHPCPMRWLRLVGSFHKQFKVSFEEYGLFYRALL